MLDVAWSASAAKTGGKVTYWAAENGLDNFDNYRVCGPTTSGINAVVTAPKTAGDFSCPVTPDPTSQLCVSRESYHPNNTGTTCYSLLFSMALSISDYYQP